jgi:hypothetical protein
MLLLFALMASVPGNDPAGMAEAKFSAQPASGPTAQAPKAVGPIAAAANDGTEKDGKPIPEGSTFVVPPANVCQSSYDLFYGSEPGVYSYWALCEPGTPAPIYDYVGAFDLTPKMSFGSGQVDGGSPGPVSDGETADSVSNSSSKVVGQGIPMNKYAGTIAAWIKADATERTVNAVYFGAVKAKSRVLIKVNTVKDAPTNFCFNADYINAAGEIFTVQKCGYTPNTWHRVVETWSGGSLNLFVDGVASQTGHYDGPLDDTIYYYSFFPGCCDTGKSMTLAKALVANQAWTAAQVKTDFAGPTVKVPTGGVAVTAQQLGSIHKDVLGYADRNTDLSTPAATNALVTGLRAAGVTSLRYGAGYGGIEVDLSDWHGGASCTKTPGTTVAAHNVTSKDNIDNYLDNVAKPLGLDIVFTINYGTDPRSCTQGGDPIVNGADVVKYLNKTKGYGVLRYEIGNEVYSNSSETDFHPNPNTGASYATYEKEFYTAMKAVDPKIEIGVPIGLAIFPWQMNFDFPVLKDASYDAVIFHNYPIIPPITDGSTLYQDRVASNTKRTHGALLKLQTELLNQGKNPNAIWVTEWDGEQYGFKWSKQTMGAVEPMFVATQLAEYMQAGVQLATWWTQAIPNGCAQRNYDYNGETTYGWWQCGNAGLVFTGPTPAAAELPVGIQPGELTPAGRAFQLLSQSGFVAEGEHMLHTQNDVVNAPWLLTYAATHAGSYAVILINRDRDQPHTVPVSLPGQTSGASVQQWTYGREQYDNTRNRNWSVGPVHTTQGKWSGAHQATLPPWSVNVVVFSK